MRMNETKKFVRVLAFEKEIAKILTVNSQLKLALVS